MPQISGEGSHSKADKQAAVSLISKPQISGVGSHSKADKQAAISQSKKYAVSLIIKPRISGAGSHSTLLESPPSLWSLACYYKGGPLRSKEVAPSLNC